MCLYMRRFYRANFLGIELFGSLVLISLSVLLINHFIGIGVFLSNFNGVRSMLYGTLAALSGAMLGFVITGLSVLLTTNTTEQIEKLKKSKHYKTIFVIFFSTSKFLGLLLITSLVSLVIDKDTDPVYVIPFITLWLIIIVGIRLLRCIWVLEKMVHLQILKN